MRRGLGNNGVGPAANRLMPGSFPAGSRPVIVEEESVAVESGDDRGVTWRTPTSADRIPTRELTSGVCEIATGGELALTVIRRSSSTSFLREPAS